MYTPLRAWACTLAAVTLAAAGAPALSQEANWPQRPIRLVVGFVPGGGTDVSARIVSAKLSEVLNQQVVVENKPGASGLIAADYVAKADPDGYTLLLASMQTTVAAPQLMQSNIDSIKYFTPVRYIGSVPNVLVINPARRNYATVQDLVNDARARPRQLMYASSGLGGPQHLSAARFSQIVGVEMEHVPYKGSGQAMTDLLGGVVDMNFDTLPGAIGQIQSKKLRPLAVTSTQRSKRLPDVPTLEEAGIRGMDILQWYAVLAPAELPAPILHKLDQALSRTLSDTEVAGKLSDQGMDVGDGPDTPAAFASYLQAEWNKYARITQSLSLSKP